MIFPSDMVVANTVVNIRNMFAIYSHADLDGKIQFVGCSTLKDVCAFTDAQNNSEWNKIFNKNSAIIITVHAYSDNDAEAYREVRRLIDQHQPHCNVRGYNMHTRYQRVRCIETGEIFNNAVSCAKGHNLTLSALYNHLKRVNGHKSVKGRTYEYTTGY